MTDDELLAKINEVTGENFASLDEISDRQLMILYISLLMAEIDQQNEQMGECRVFTCRKEEVHE